jgi:hypothetical protein
VTSVLVRLGTALAAVGLAIGLAACGATSPAPGPMMGATGSSDDTDDGYGMPGGMMSGRPPSPASAPHTGPIVGEGLDPASATALQAAVDRGVQPWRYEPDLTALAFVRGRLGWMMPRARVTAPDTVLVDDRAGGEVSLHLVQPARTGTSGVWTVTGGTWLR